MLDSVAPHNNLRGHGYFEMAMVLFCLLAFHICVLLGQASQTTCKVRAVKEATSTEIMCHFSEDISQSQRGFTVYRYQDDLTPTKVADCLWETQLKCITKKRYEYKETVVTDNITIQIPRLTADETGKYWCQVTGAKKGNWDFCELSEVVVDCRWRAVEMRCIVMSGYDYDRVVSNTTTVRLPRVLTRAAKVADCLRETQLKCITKKRYEYKETVVTDNITIQIPRLTADETKILVPGNQSQERRLGLLQTIREHELNDFIIRLCCNTNLTYYYSKDLRESKINFALYHFSGRGSPDNYALLSF